MPKRKREVDDTISSSSPSSAAVNIPQYVVVEEILEKLPVKSLMRFKAVSKQWRREIESRRFQERHLRHEQTSGDPSILVNESVLNDGGEGSLRTLRLGETSISLENHTRYPVHSNKQVYVGITRSCDGLICMYSKAFVCVINPATRWYRKLPDARLQALIRDTMFPKGPVMGFGKDNITGIYKIVWLYNSGCFNVNVDGGQTNTCEVFSFDTNNTWRHDVIVSSPHPVLDYKKPAQAHGSLHWFIDAGTETQVLSFDLHTETFTVMTKIPIAHAPHTRINMCTLNNRLSLSEDKGDTQTIWSLNPDNVTWVKTYSINLRSTLNCPTHEEYYEEYLRTQPPIASLFNNRLLLYDSSDDKDKLVLYNSRFNSFSPFFFAPYNMGGAVSYYPSLITLP